MTDSNPAPEQPVSNKKWPWPIIIIAMLTAFWMIGPYVSYYTGWFVPSGTSNNGILLEPPVHVTDLLSGTNTTVSEALPELGDDQWHILIPITASCGEACEQNLYTTRQVHIRLGEKRLRLQRVAVNLAGDRGKAYIESLAQEHPLLSDVTVAVEDWQRWLAPTNAPGVHEKPYYLLMHPAGHAILYYTADHHGNELLEDVKHGLRVTPE